MTPRAGATWQERLRFYASEDESGCWTWTGCHDLRGYGLFNGPEGHPLPKMSGAHRWMYYLLVGPIPDGLELDHLCVNPPCVNPAHLEPVTREENMRRAMERRTHCKAGHEYTAKNTYMRADGGRKCRRCAADRQLRYSAARRAREQVAA